MVILLTISHSKKCNIIAKKYVSMQKILSIINKTLFIKILEHSVIIFVSDNAKKQLQHET